MRLCTRVLPSFAFLSLLAIPGMARAADVQWTNPAGGNWSVGANWSSGSPPGASDTAVFSALAGPYTVVIQGSRSAETLAINSPNVTLQIQGSSAGLGRMTVNNGFTNNGVIELTDIDSNWGAELTVTSGALTNAPGAEIRTLVGSNGSRTLNLQLVNQGTVSIARATTLGRSGADHVNSGTLLISGGNLSVNQTGTTPSFANSGTFDGAGGNVTVSGGTVTNTGTLSVGAGRTLLFSSNAVFNQDAGTLTTASGTLSFSNATGNFATNYSNAGSTLLLSSATLNGPGTITNASGLTLASSTINAPFVSQADIVVTGAATIANPTGSFANPTGATLRVQGASAGGVGRLTVTNGFSNNGVIELTDIDSNWGADLTVTNGTLSNAPGAEIRTLVGANGSRALNLQLVNQGTVSIARATTLGRASADHVNSGTLLISGGSLSVNQTGTTPSFANSGTFDGAGGNVTVSGGTVTNTGTLSVDAGRTLLFASGAVFNQDAGTLSTLGGTLSFSNATGNFATNYSNISSTLLLSSATINGPGTITNASGLTLASSTINALFVNQADILVTGAATIANPTGSFANAAGATLRVQGASAGGMGRLTVSNGFTNSGVIELTDIDSSWGAELTVTNGTLTNAPSAEIRSLVGSNGSRALNLQLVNQGTVSIARATTLGRAAADHLNSGTLLISGGSLTVNQTGTTPTFGNSGTFSCAGGSATFSGGTMTNTGTLSVDAGRTLLFNTTAVFNQDAGTLTTAGGTLSFNIATGNFTTNYSNADSTLLLSSATLNGPGTITNAGGGLTLTNSTINAPFVSQADIFVTGASTIANPNGSFANAAGATLRIQGASAGGMGRLTVTNGFTNNGVIELTDIDSSWGAQLTVTNGALTNAPGAEFRALVGFAGSRRFSGTLSNLGLITIDLGQLFSVTGTITQQYPGRIDFFAAGLDPQQLSRLAVTGAAQLEGGIGMTLVDEFLPAIDDVFQIITYGSLSDAIGCFDIAGLFFGTGLRYTLIRNATNLTLQVVDTPVQTGDVRCDCTVDLADLSILLAHFGSTTARQSEGDLDDDGQVSLGDLAILLSYFGSVCPE